MFSLRKCVLIINTVFLSACGTTFIGNQVENIDTKNQAGLHYHLPEDVVEVVVTFEHTTVTGLKNNGDKIEKNVSEETQTVGAAINLQTIADTSRTFIIDASATGFSKNNTALTLTETGLLQSVNAKTTGSGGVVFDNVMKIAGSVLPLVTTGGFSLLDSTLPTAQANIFKLQNHAFISRFDLALPSTTKSIKHATCDENVLREKYLPGTIEYRFAFQDLPNKDELVRDFCDTFTLVDERRQSYRTTLSAFDSESDEKRLGVLNTKLTRLKDEYALAVTQHSNARTSIVTAIEQAIQNAGLGKKSERYTQRSIMHFSALPSRTSIGALGITSVQDNASLRNLIVQATTTSSIPTAASVSASKPALAQEIAALFNATGIIVTAEPLGADISKAGKAATPDGFEACDSSKGATATPCVFYRSPRSYLLSAWTTQKIAGEQGKSQLIQSDSKIVDAISDAAPILAIELRESTFTKRDSTLAFSPRGRLTGLTRDYGSAAEDASSSVASGLSNGIAQYQTTLSNIKTIRDTENQIQLQPLSQQLAVANAHSALDLQPIQAQVALAQQQLALINGQTSLQAATQGQSAALQTQLTTIQNSLTAAQSQLVTNQTTLVNAQATAAQTSEQASLIASTNLLGAQIKELQNEIALLKLKQDIDALKKNNAP